MKPLPMMCAITLIVTLGMSRVDTGHAQQRPREDPACTVLGEAFFQQTTFREQGVSLKEAMEVAAQAAQAVAAKAPPQSPIGGVPLVTGFTVLAFTVAKNVYYNIPYKHLGPEMNRVTAVARCTHVGYEAFYDELARSGKEKAR
jgi:hypothetical protein